MIRVCDAIMGSGKTSAAITYMNERTDKRFIYITPYLSEVSRVLDACASRGFVEPKKKIKEYEYTKTGHTKRLIEDGANIVTTHQAFSYYTKDMLDTIRKQHYTLIIDESLSSMGKTDTLPCDLEILTKSEFVKETEDGYTLKKEGYTGSKYVEEMRYLQSRDLIRDDGSDDVPGAYYWLLPADLISAFDDVIVLTYLFEAQEMCYFMLLHHMEYKKIGVEVDEDGTYRFGDYMKYIPEYTKTLGNHIHICDHKKLNDIGKSKFALSKAWLSRKANTDKLRKDIYNYFKNIMGDHDAEERMWGSYDKTENALRGKGYSKGFVVFNERATNAYSDKRVLVYAVNVFPNSGKKLFMSKHGIEINDDLYALSFIVQWIWRSAIRNGEDIWIYIPSKRMRDILIDWIDKVEHGVPIC